MKFKNIIFATLGFIAVVLMIYSSYWVAKTVSYNLFYDDMVIETITEIVKSECLIP